MKRMLIPPQKAERAPVDCIPAPVSVAHRIEKEVCEKHGITRQVLLGASRAKNIMPARWELAYRLVFEAGLNWSEAGRRINRDHSTVRYSCNKWARMNSLPGAPEVESDAERKQRLAMLRAEQRQKLRGELDARILAEFLAGKSAKQISTEIPGATRAITAAAIAKATARGEQ